MNPTLFYRKGTEGASGFGLLVGLFDTLAGDLRRAVKRSAPEILRSDAKKAITRCLSLATGRLG